MSRDGRRKAYIIAEKFGDITFDTREGEVGNPPGP